MLFLHKDNIEQLFLYSLFNCFNQNKIYMKRISIKDLAKKTGLSTTTISRVLNGKAKQYRISDEAAQLVILTAQKEGYKPDRNAVSLRTNRSHTIGVIVPNIADYYFSSLSRMIEIAARKIGYSILLSDSQESLELEIESIDTLISRKVDGLIILPIGNKSQHLSNVIELGMPLVLADRHFPLLECPQVFSDNHNGAFCATELLIKKNHTRIACIQGRQNTSVNNERILGYKEALAKYGIKPDPSLIIGDEFGLRSGYVSAKILINLIPRPSAIFAFSNTISLGALRAIYEENLNIPNDISLVSFDHDQPYSEFLKTPITSVVQQTSELGQIAFKLLMAEINNKDSSKEQESLSKAKFVTLPTTLKERKSVKTIKQGKRILISKMKN